MSSEHTKPKQFTEEDIDSIEGWNIYYKDYFIDLLNGDYDLDEAKEDLQGLINSKYDSRVITKTPSMGEEET